MSYEYDVALSFADEDREYVEKVAMYLKKKGVNFFYDEYEEADLWGKDLYVHLDEVYRKKAKYCVMFLSKNYALKVWPTHERESAQARALEGKEEYILPARFDDTAIPGIRPTMGYIDLRTKSPEELGGLILKKIGKKGVTVTGEEEQEFRKPKIVRQSFNPYDEAQKFIDFISIELKKRCPALFNQGVSLSIFNREGRTCFRVVRDGKTKYSLDVWIGGISGDSSLSFYGIEGEPHLSSGSTNAWGDVIWSKERESVVIELHDMSLLEMLGKDRRYTKEEFSDVLWNKICDVLESEE